MKYYNSFFLSFQFLKNGDKIFREYLITVCISLFPYKKRGVFTFQKKTKEWRFTEMCVFLCVKMEQETQQRYIYKWGNVCITRLGEVRGKMSL